MPLTIDWSASLVKITSPTVSVDAQTLHDFIEDEMASPVGLMNSAIIQPEGKIEDPTNPGVYSQIIIIFNSPWQVQFWGGSGYTTIYGGKVIGGLNDQPLKATGTAGDISVLNSPVDGLTVVPGLEDAELARKYLTNRQEIELVGADWYLITYDDDDSELGRQLLLDVDGNTPTIQTGVIVQRAKIT